MFTHTHTHTHTQTNKCMHTQKQVFNLKRMGNKKQLKKLKHIVMYLIQQNTKTDQNLNIHVANTKSISSRDLNEHHERIRGL